MQRYFINRSKITDDLALINGNDFHHMKNVMRFNLGDEVVINTDEGDVYLACLEEIQKQQIVLRILEKLPAKPLCYHLDIGLSLIKRDALELAIKKITELGVAGIKLLETERSVIKFNDYDRKKERLTTIIKESSEQSERTMMPTLEYCSSIEQIDVSKYNHLIYGYARENVKNFKSTLLNIKQGDRTLILIGPEGGFSLSDIEKLKRKGFVSVSFGDTILRAETAAIYAASVYRLMVGEE